MEKIFYIYALIDPGNGEMFYIGKGKERRYSSHVKEKDINLDNSLKNRRIRKIERSHQRVKIDVLFSCLAEKDALDLERLIIYRLGRAVLNEGRLTNIVPGGNWNRWNDSVLHNENDVPFFDINSLSIEEQKKLANIEKRSDFNYLNTNDQNQIIYQFSICGELLSVQSIEEFFRGGITSERVEILTALRENVFPIYNGCLYSKVYLKEVYVSNLLPLELLDIVDIEFHKQFDKYYREKAQFSLKVEHAGKLRFQVDRKSEYISLWTYYHTGYKKYFTKRKIGEKFGSSKSWYKNGNLKEERIYKNGEIKTYFSFYENGQKKFENSHKGPGGNLIHCEWYENGHLAMKYVENIGYIFYNQKGKYLRTDSLDIANPGGQTALKFE